MKVLLVSPGTPERTSWYSPSPIECVVLLTPTPEKVTVQTVPPAEGVRTTFGTSEFGVFWHVILPLCKPAVAALAIFTFVRYWNDFLWPVIALNKPQNYTLTVGVANLQGEFITDFGVIFAGAALAALPMVVFFLAFQRYFLEGVRMGARAFGVSGSGICHWQPVPCVESQWLHQWHRASAAVAAVRSW